MCLDDNKASYPLIIHFFKAFKRHVPGKGAYAPPWDLGLVLEDLTKAPFEPLSAPPGQWLLLGLRAGSTFEQVCKTATWTSSLNTFFFYYALLHRLTVVSGSELFGLKCFRQ